MDKYEVRHIGPAASKPEQGPAPIAEPIERITEIFEVLLEREPQLTRELILALRGADTAVLVKWFVGARRVD